MSWGIAAGIGLGLLNSFSQAEAEKDRIEAIKEANLSKIAADGALFKANSDAITLARAQNREEAGNAIIEYARASAANIREAGVQIEQQASTVSARDEGITAGVSAARQLSTFYTQASKELGAMEQQAVAGITAIADNLQQADNDLVKQDQNNFNNLLYSMATGLQTAQSSTNPLSGLTNIVQGIGTGMSLQKGISNLQANNTPTQ